MKFKSQDTSIMHKSPGLLCCICVLVGMEMICSGSWRERDVVGFFHVPWAVETMVGPWQAPQFVVP